MRAQFMANQYVCMADAHNTYTAFDVMLSAVEFNEALSQALNESGMVGFLN